MQAERFSKNQKTRGKAHYQTLNRADIDR